MCKGSGCSVLMEGVTFNFCTLVALDGAAVTLTHCDFKASLEIGTGICLLAHRAGTRVQASNCCFTGGLQCTAVHAGALFQGRKIQCSSSTVQGMEVKDAGSKLTLSGGCSVRDVDALRQHTTSRLYSKGVFVHTGGSAVLEGCTVAGCVRYVVVYTVSVYSNNILI